MDPGSSDCIWLEAIVGANSGKYQSPPGKGTSGTEAWAYVYMGNDCTGARRVRFSGYVPVPDQAFKVTSTSARLTTTIDIWEYDPDTGEYSGLSFPVNIDVTWTGSKPAVRQSDHEHINSKGFTLNYRWTGLYQLADASGTVSDGTTNYASPGTIYNANFGSGRTMLVRVE